MAYWLLKSEPSTFSIDDLAKSNKHTTAWEGVRNFQARNFLRHEMRKGDLAFFYHSSCPEPGIVGIVEVVKAGYPDPSAFDAKSPYYDEKSNLANPTWFTVDVKLQKKFSHLISLAELRNNAKLQPMKLLQKGNRLSVLPVSEQEWQIILKMQK